MFVMERLNFVLIQEPWVSNEGPISGLGNCPGRNRTGSPSSSNAGTNRIWQNEQQATRAGMRRKRVIVPPKRTRKCHHCYFSECSELSHTVLLTLQIIWRG
nr:unnamed protein product [Callosobruchus analis]